MTDSRGKVQNRCHSAWLMTGVGRCWGSCYQWGSHLPLELRNSLWWEPVFWGPAGGCIVLFGSSGIIPHDCRRRRPSSGLETVWDAPFLVTITVAGTLWLFRALVIVFIWRHVLRVYWERSAYRCIPVYGAGRSGVDHAFVRSFSFAGKKWIFMRTSLGIDASRCFGFGMRCMRSMLRSIGDISGSSWAIISPANFLQINRGLRLGDHP